MGDFADDLKNQDNERGYQPKDLSTCRHCTTTIDLNVNSYGLCDDCIEKLKSSK